MPLFVSISLWVAPWVKCWQKAWQAMNTWSLHCGRWLCESYGGTNHRLRWVLMVRNKRVRNDFFIPWILVIYKFLYTSVIRQGIPMNALEWIQTVLPIPHDDAMTWKRFLCYWQFISQRADQVRFNNSFVLAQRNCPINCRVDGD